MLSARMKAGERSESNAEGNCCASCPCSSCDTSAKAHVDIVDRPIPVAPVQFRVVVLAIMGFQFEPLIHRMVDKHTWEEAEAREVFEDLKRFLALAATHTESIVPPPKVDDMWHDFILFTQDYEAFCHNHAGRFIHHVPRRRNEVITTSSGKNPIRGTLEIARATFGDLSQHWTYPLKNGKTCSTVGCHNACNSAVLVGTNLKEGDCSDCAPVACGHR